MKEELRKSIRADYEKNNITLGAKLPIYHVRWNPDKDTFAIYQDDENGFCEFSTLTPEQVCHYLKSANKGAIFEIGACEYTMIERECNQCGNIWEYQLALNQVRCPKCKGEDTFIKNERVEKEME